MKMRAFQLFYKQQDGALTPVDGHLQSLAVEFAARELKNPVELTDFKNVWAACEVDEDDKPIRCLGLLGMQLKADFPLCRFTDNVATKLLVERASDYLHDQGARGAEVFVYIDLDESPEQLCPNREAWLKAFKMKPAKRWSFFVK